MTEQTRSDAELVSTWLDGDKASFAAIYDRYANDLYAFAMSRLRNRAEAADVVQETFLRAAGRLGQLRDRSRLRPWLYAIARNRVIDATRRPMSYFDVEEFAEMPADQPEPADIAARSELAELLWLAADGLNERDRELLGLHLHHGLDGADLADVVGVTPANLYVSMSRLKERMAKAVGALLIARHGSKDCPALASVLAGWDGTFSLEVRSRVTRHVEGCEECTRRRTALITAASLSAGALAVPFAAPAHLRADTLGQLDVPVHPLDAAGPSGDSPRGGGPSGGTPSRGRQGVGGPERWRPNGFPAPQRTARRRVLVLATAGACVVGLIVGVASLAASDAPPRVSSAAQSGAENTTATTASATAPAPPDSTPADDPAVAPTTTPSSAPTTETSITEALAPAGSVGAPAIDETATTATTATIAAMTAQVDVAIGLHTPQSPSSSLPVTSESTDPPLVQPPPPTAPATTAPVVSPPPSTPATPPPTLPPTGTSAPETTVAATTVAPPPPPPPLPGKIVVVTGPIDLGQSTVSGTARLRNDGGQNAAWTATAGLAGFSVSPASGSLAPGAVADVQISVNRTALAEGNHATTVTFASPGGSGSVNVSARVERAPVINSFVRTPPIVRNSISCGATLVNVSVTATDESGIGSVEVVWSSDGSFAQRTALSHSGGNTYSGTIGSFSKLGTNNFTAHVLDTRGNSSTASASVVVIAC